MTDEPTVVSEQEIQAYVDDRLQGAQRDRIAAAIASDPAVSRRARALRRLHEHLHSAYDPVLGEPVPARMLRTIIGTRPPRLLRAVAVLAWMALGGIIGALLGARPDIDPVAQIRPLAREAAFAHAVYVPEVRHAVEVRAEERAHLNAWLSKRLQQPIVAPDVRDAGYQLVGGRLLADAGRPAAQFMYEDEQGRRLTLYVRAPREPTGDSAFRVVEDGDLSIVYWTDGALAYALTGARARDQMLQTAARFHRALNP